MLNKSADAAIAAMSLLAEIYDGDRMVLTASQIAEKRNLQKPFVAKLLTILSQNELINGTPGRNGGYYLARVPSSITLADVAACFTKLDRPMACPFGRYYCGIGPACPLHEDLQKLHQSLDDFLKKTTLDIFAAKGAHAHLHCKRAS